jgi:hypothetical protein
MQNGMLRHISFNKLFFELLSGRVDSKLAKTGTVTRNYVSLLKIKYWYQKRQMLMVD